MQTRRIPTLLALALPFLLLVPTAAAAGPALDLGDEWSLKFDAQIRPRLILDSGMDFVDGDASRAVVTQRSRLGATLGHADGLAARLTLQDIRLWGEELDTLNDFSANGLDLHEAFVLIPLGARLSLQAGRQEINLDAQRLVGAVDWSQRARSFDALRLVYEREGWTMDLFFSKVATQYGYADGTLLEPAEDTNVDFAGAHFGLPIVPDLKLSVLYLFNARWHTEDVRHTAGAFASGNAGGLSYMAEAYYQAASVADESGSSFLAAGRVGYTLASPFKPSITVWAEYLSGDGTPEGVFDTLYATNHKFYGEMDLFLNIPVHTANLGLVDIGGRLAAVPAGDFTALVDFHHLTSADETAGGESVFGDELDFKVTWKATDAISVRALYGVFLPGEAIRVPRGVPAGADLEAEHFGYLTLDVQI